MFKKLSQVKDSNSLSNRFRRRRFSLFTKLLGSVHRPMVKILDVGGTVDFWSKMGFIEKKNVKITILNIKKEKPTGKNLVSVVGDATKLKGFKEGEFDIVFSNSVIEHLFSLENQKKMAEEVKRVGLNYFIQTPNKYFPIEPHFLFPFFQFFPFSWRVGLLMRFNLGWRKRQKIKKRAEKSVSEIKLLSTCDMKKLFPNSFLWKEKFFGFTKSIVVYGGKDFRKKNVKRKWFFGLVLILLIALLISVKFFVDKKIRFEHVQHKNKVISQVLELEDKIENLEIKLKEISNTSFISRDERIELESNLRELELKIQELRTEQLNFSNDSSIQIYMRIYPIDSEVIYKSWYLPVDIERLIRGIENYIFDYGNSEIQKSYIDENLSRIKWRVNLIKSLE